MLNIALDADGGLVLGQQEGQDLDDTVWNVSMAAGVCLGLVAMTVRDDIIPLVIAPFVQVSDMSLQPALRFVGRLMRTMYPSVWREEALCRAVDT